MSVSPDRLAIPFGLFATLLLAAQTTVPVAVDATVHDAAGKVLAGVELADLWSLTHGKLVPGFVCPNRGSPSLSSDADGRVRGEWILSPFETPLLALSADRRLACFVYPQWERDATLPKVTGTIVLEPAVRLRFESRAPRVRGVMLPFTVSASWEREDEDPLGERVIRSHHQMFGVDRETVEIVLPPGSYQLRLRSRGGLSPARTVVLDGTRKTLDLGTIPRTVTPLDRLDEVLPDWHVDDARNIDVAKSGLGDFRGKPLFVHFHETARRRLREDNATRRTLAALADHRAGDRFRVVLFDLVASGDASDHVDGPEPVIERMFPVLCDRSRKTSAIYGPTFDRAILLDRDGKLIACGQVNEVVEALDRHLERR